MSEPTIAAGFARAFLDFAAAKGARRRSLIEQSQIDPENLTDPDKRVPLANYIALMKAGIQLCNQPALALHFGEQVSLRDISILGLLGRGETAEEACQHATRYIRLAIDDGNRESAPIEFVRENNNVWLRFNSELYVEHPPLTESAFARCMSGRGNGCHWPYPKAFSFTHKEPSYRAEYDRILRAPLSFGSDKNAILFGDELLSVRLPPTSRYILDLLTERAEGLLATLESANSTRDRVESLLRSMLPGGEVSVEIISRKLGVSRQTLFRKLKAEGVTFERVLDELRHKLALHYLKEKRISVSETAYLVGFSDPGSFSRAFKRWTGSSPGLSKP